MRRPVVLVGRLLAVALVIVVTALGGTASAGANTKEPSAACGSSGARLGLQDLRYAREYRHLLSLKAEKAWPGWSRTAPLLLRDSRCEYLIGHPKAPKSFSLVQGVDVRGWRVHAAPLGTLTPGPVASTWKVGSTWVAMIPTRGEFQRTLDQQLGKGVVRLDDASYMRSLVHESFHAHQMTVTRGSPPSFGSAIDERRAGELLAELGDAESLLVREGRALSAALGATSLREARDEAKVFASLREVRRRATDAPSVLEAFERQLEWTEGMARYVDLRLILLAGSRGYTPTKGIRYPPAATYRGAFLDQLVDPSPRADGLRGRWQDLGAAEAMLLDRLYAGWREAALPGKSSLEGLLRQAGEVPAPLSALRVARIGVAGRHLNVALAERSDSWSKGLAGVDDLGRLDGLLLAFGEDASAPFWMRGALIPLDIAFFDSGGRLLDVKEMPLCASDPCPIYGSPRPYRFALETPTGALRDLRVGAKLVLPAALSS